MGVLSLLVCIALITVNGLKADTGCIDEQFIKDMEGFETGGYVPKRNGVVLGHSGVHIGNGVDLGSKNRQYFEDLDVPATVIDELEPYFGLQKEEAVAKLDAVPLTLTQAQAEDLSERVIEANIESVKNTYSNAIGAGKLSWDELTDAQRTVMTSVLFQYGSPTKTPTFWGHCKDQDWVKVEAELRNFGDRYSSCRKKEADLLKNDDGSNCDVRPTTTTLPTTTTTIAPAETCASVEKVLRADWNARSPRRSISPLSQPVKMVFIHHTTGNRCFNKASCITKIQQHQDYHMDTRGYSDIGYNYLIGEDGRAYEGRGLNLQGGHTYNYNTKAISISVIGNFNPVRPNDAALNAIKSIINCAVDAGIAVKNYKLYGHRDASCTESPGEKLYEEIQTWPKYSTTPIQKYWDKKAVSECDLSESTTPATPTGTPTNTGGVCTRYGDIRILRPKGASAATAQQDQLATTGVDASNKLVDKDLSELNKYKECFYEVGLRLNIHPALIAAIASRESRGGALLNARGYGDNGKEYGIMQCNIQHSGLQCTKYGPKSCEHINMLIEEKLIPDIASVQQKQRTWPAERQQQGAVAAYNFGVSNVQTWDQLDHGSTNNDYSHDVIARAQRLIALHGWTCNATPSVVIPSPTAPLTPTGDCECMEFAEAGNCDFYTQCVEKQLPCGDTGYALGYAQKYCNRFTQFYNDFNDDGKEWVDKVRVCLMMDILPRSRKPGITCDRLLEVAFNSHVKCYVNSGPGISKVVEEAVNRDILLKVYELEDFVGQQWKRALKQVLEITFDCGLSSVKSWYDSTKGRLGDAVNAVADWFENVGKKKQSVKMDCESYAASGDCRFYECFESKFPCAKEMGYSHVRDYELPHCLAFNNLQGSETVSTWMTGTQTCMMSHLKTLFDQSSVNCSSLQLEMYEKRVNCMVNNGFCPFEQAEEWMIERGTLSHGYPELPPVEYTHRPLSGTTHMNENDYYRVLQTFKGQIGQANAKCAEQGDRVSNSLYKLVDTTFGLLRIRTEF